MMSVVGITRFMLSFCFWTNLEKHKVIKFGKEKAQKVYQLILGDLNKTCGATFYIVASFRGIVEETRFSGTYTRYFTWPWWDAV